MRTVGGVSDPAIDEHFKRSLGLEEYAAVFNATTTDKEPGLSGKLLKLSLKKCKKEKKQKIDMLIFLFPVDDHFAKALGETWTRLQATSRSKDST